MASKEPVIHCRPHISPPSVPIMCKINPVSIIISHLPSRPCYYSVEKHLSSSLLSKDLKVRIYETVILPVVLYGCETWTLTLREEHMLMVFENKVLRKIFGAKRDKVTGERRKLHNTELQALYSSPDKIRNIKSRRLRWAGHVWANPEMHIECQQLLSPTDNSEINGGRSGVEIFGVDVQRILLSRVQKKENFSSSATYSRLIYKHVKRIYGCETWTLTLREEQRLRVFENKVLRKIFGANRDEVTGEWRKLHNTELHALYSSPDVIRNIKSRRLRWAGHVARMGESRNAYRVLVGRPEGKRPLGRSRRRWEDNIKMDLREMGYDDREWINLAQDRDRWRAYVRAAMNLRSVTKPEQASQSCVPEFDSSVRPQLLSASEGPEFECSGPQLEGPEFECSGPQLEGPEFEYSELSLKVCGSRFCELE
ncbi:hypothetical protein ANN_08966 [Periplaneta americana]|uniref:Uncharacterized protein n=1 Tax=Periplaneta americana TaxID=6978 RepID=A0ABQ8T2Q6_PERAM|nr:hypothetical protein ANN_08966 [Periplaneta americana]